MDRRDLLQGLSMAGMATLLPGAAGASTADGGREPKVAGSGDPPLHPPATGDIPVAFLVSDTAVVIDFAGPWEVFQDVVVPGRAQPNPFRLFTVAETTGSIRASGGMRIVPDYSIEDAPVPKVLVIPAQKSPSPAVIAWVRKVARTADMTMSVCTGAFLLARTGLLSGKPVTTHHGAFAELAIDFPDVTVRRGARFVDNGGIASSGGLSSGIDLALHVVERYFGRTVAASTADTMEYQGIGWMNAASNQAYARARVSTMQHPICAVCEMDVDAKTAPQEIYRRKTFLFCGEPHKALFEANPARFVPT